jgi:hypothetical protein
MAKLSLAVGVVAAIVLVTFAPSLTARTQNTGRFEYVRMSPVGTRINTSATSIQIRYGYRACVATAAEWTCREFPPTESSDAALRVTLATLGNEGWELVSTVNEELESNKPLTYLFKRQVR